jgi:general secretion pathway protein A
MMYQQFYGFKEPPFNLTPDSKFLFLSHRHQEALASMIFGVQERKGFILLTGEIGCGKTTLCRAMLSQLDSELVKVCMVLNSYLTDVELLKTINEGFGLPGESDSKKKLLDTLNEFLVDQYSKGHNVVLVIDESQNLRPETLEQVRMISNLETETDKLIQILLIGQPELRRTLALPELEQLNQRITVRYHITPLEEGEVADYVRHRLSIAEPQVEIEFAGKAYQMIHHFSRGVPRRINVICDRCLLIAYTQGTFKIDDKIVQQAVGEVRGESQGYGPVSTTGLEVGAGGLGRFVWAMVKMAAVACVIAAGVFLGNYLIQNRNGATVATGGPSPAPTVTPFVPEMGTPAPEATPAATPGATPATTPVSTAITTATATPTPSPTPFRYQNWQTDADRWVRVSDDRLSEAASYINLLTLWGIPVAMETFTESRPEEVQQFDMLATIKSNPLNFNALPTDTLGEALRLDMPVLIELQGDPGSARWCVIRAMSGEMLTLVDPINGQRTVRRSQLEPLVRRGIVPFKDPDGIVGITPGEQSERVRVLQEWLAAEGHYEGTADGKYGGGTREAIQAFQQQAGLEPTGTLDIATAAVIATRLNPQRPRLYT